MTLTFKEIIFFLLR